MLRVLIIGYGNPLRGDDGFGFAAAERLRAVIDDPEIEVLAVHQLTPELAEPLSRAQLAIFIDAAATGEPGAIARRTLAPEAPCGSTHHAPPAALLAAAQRLFGRAPEAILYSVPAECVDFGYAFTPAVRAALDRVVAEIAARVGSRE